MFRPCTEPRILFVSVLALCLTGQAVAGDEDEFDFLEDDEDELIIAPSGNGVSRAALIDMGDEDPSWDMESPSDALPESEDEDPIEEFDEPVEDFGLPEEELEEDIRGRQEDRGIGLDTEGKLPLLDNYPLKVVAQDLDAVVVELPVLVAQSRSDFETEFWIVTEIRVNGSRVGENRQLVTADSISDLGSSFAWVKVFVPISETQGTIEFRIDREDPETGEIAPQFSTSTVYQR